MEKINRLKKLFNNYKLDGYIVPKNDEFFGEYVPENNDKLKFISNFSGSFGFALILKNKNYLFVDGRYSLQAKIESGKLFNIVTIPNKFPSDILKKKKLKIGFDPKLYTQKTLKIFFQKTKCEMISINHNLIDKLQNNEKKIKNIKKFYLLPKNAVGKNYKVKINILVNLMIKKKIDFQFISASENIAWLLNIRGQDSKFTPIPNAYLTLDSSYNINLFCDLKKIEHKFKNKFKYIKFIDIKFTNLFLSKINNKRISIDSSSCSIYFENILKKNNKIVEFLDPTYFLKSIKSKIEIKNTIKSHIDDGVALTKFIFWLKKNYRKKGINEISAQEKLFKFRKKNKNFKFLSFPTISGTGPNGAIIHYRATNESSKVINKKDLFLCDSGGQYKYGTTDVTRTICFSDQSQKIKNIYTKVLKGHIAVVTSNLSRYNKGSQIDIRARKYLKKDGLDYAHGTGHGVGFFSNVHEGPQSISKYNTIKLQKGMVVSNEPGYYKENHFGIRIENLIFVNKKKELFFENLTLSPIEKDLVNYKLLNKKERNYLDTYHLDILSKYYKYLNKTEKKWLLTLI